MVGVAKKRVFGAIVLGATVGVYWSAASAETASVETSTESHWSCAGVPVLSTPGGPFLAEALPASVRAGFPDYPNDVEREALVEKLRESRTGDHLVALLSNEGAATTADALVHVVFEELTLDIYRMRRALYAAGALHPPGAGTRLGPARENLDLLVERLVAATINADAPVPPDAAVNVAHALRTELELGIVEGIGVPDTEAASALLLDALSVPDPAVQYAAISALAKVPGFPQQAEVEEHLAGIDDEPTRTCMLQAIGGAP